MTEKEIQLELEAIRHPKGGFLYYLRHYAKIIEPPTQTTPGGVIDFQLWPHLLELTAALLIEPLIVVMKSRQIGISWLLAHWVLWNMLTKMADMTVEFSKGEVEAMELLGKSTEGYKQLPPWLQFKMKPDSATEIGFPCMSSRAKAFPATATASVSFTASRIIDDEWDLHQYAETNYSESLPVRDAGGQFIGVFTPRKQNLNHLAMAIYLGAKAGKNGFKHFFFPYDVRPGRDEAWYEDKKRNIPEGELAGLTPELHMEGNYPRSEEEALRPSQTIAAIDLQVLEAMRQDCHAPLRIEGAELDQGICHIYQDFHPSNTYIAASDTSHGTGKDYSVTLIMNVRTGAIVADIMENRLSPEVFAMHSLALLKYFNFPKWWPEDNEWGRSLIDHALAQGYRNMGYQDAKRTRPGWHTGPSGPNSREVLFGKLIPAFNNRQIVIYNYQGLLQFGDLVRNADKGGRIEAAIHKNDDYPLTVGICLMKQDEISLNIEQPKPIKTLTFAGSAKRDTFFD